MLTGCKLGVGILGRPRNTSFSGCHPARRPPGSFWWNFWAIKVSFFFLKRLEVRKIVDSPHRFNIGGEVWWSLSRLTIFTFSLISPYLPVTQLASWVLMSPLPTKHWGRIMPINNKLTTKDDGGHRRLHYFGHRLGKVVTTSYIFNKQAIPGKKKRWSWTEGDAFGLRNSSTLLNLWGKWILRDLWKGELRKGDLEKGENLQA